MKTALMAALAVVVSAIPISTPSFASGPATSGLSLWLQSDKGLAADGSTWLDQSGNGNDATALSGQNPTVVPNAINGLPAVQFGGGQAMSFASQIITGQQFTIFAVASDATTSFAGFREIFSNWDAANTISSVFLGTTGYPVAVRFTDDIGGATDPIHTQTGVGVISNANQPFLLTAVSGSTDAWLNLNGSPFYDNGAALSTRDLTTGYYLGQQGSGPFEYWNGTIEALLVYNGALSPSDIAQTEGYLISTYGVGSPVPEPSTWALMLAGFAGLGGLAYAHSRRGHAAG